MKLYKKTFKHRAVVLSSIACLSLIFAVDMISINDKDKDSRGKSGRGIDIGQTDESPTKIKNDNSTPQKAAPAYKGETHKNQATISVTNVKDSAYYSDVVKINGWWIGRGKKITKEYASHLNCYYKFSQKNSAGNWTLLEAFDGYGKPQTQHNLATYLVNQFDDEDSDANSVWKQSLTTVCKWQMIGDATGKEVVQERGLDADNNIVFCYNPVQVGERTYVGSYTDNQGLPIRLRTDSLGNDAHMANYVQVTRDERGREVLLRFTDRNGFPYKNKDGAYMTRKGYNDDNYQISEESLNIAGQRMIDDFSNCGWTAEYKDGHESAATFRDADWEPMRMKPNKASITTCTSIKREYDGYGRMIEESYYLPDGTPDVTDEGVHRITLEYNNHGQRTHTVWYDIKGNKTGYDSKGICELRAYYDETTGDWLGGEDLDANGGYVNEPGDMCKWEYEYSQPGVIKHQVNYTAVNKKPIKKFEFTRDESGNEVRKWYDDNQCRTDSVDSKGRATLTKWTDLDGNLINGADSKSWARFVTTYTDSGYIEAWFDKDGEPFNDSESDCTHRIYINDSTTWQMTQYQYYNSVLQEAFVKQFTPNFESIIAQWDITPNGEQARVGWWKNLYYNCKVDYTIYGELRSMEILNEFGEPAYSRELWNGGGVYYYREPKSDRYFDENGNEIASADMEDFKRSLPKAFCLEITDEDIAEDYGFKNGDIILSYGDWHVCEDLKSNIDQFYVESILNRMDKKDITLLRHDVTTGESKLVYQTLPEGTWDYFGFYPHMIYYTQKEKNRLVTNAKKYQFDFGKAPSYTETAVVMVPEKGGVFSSRGYNFYDFTSPAFVLAAGVTDNNDNQDLYWNYAKNYASEFEYEMSDGWPYTDVNLTYTINLSSDKTYSRGRSLYNFGLRFIPVKVSDTLVAKLTRLAHEADIDYAPVTVTKDQVVGKWAMTYSDTDFKESSDITLNCTIEFKEDGKMTSLQTLILQKDDDTAITIDLPTEGSWMLDNGIITNDIKYIENKVKVKVTSPSSTKEQINDKLNDVKTNMVPKLLEGENVFSTMKIKTIDSNTMTIRYGEETLTFRRK